MPLWKDRNGPNRKLTIAMPIGEDRNGPNKQLQTVLPLGRNRACRLPNKIIDDRTAIRERIIVCRGGCLKFSRPVKVEIFTGRVPPQPQSLVPTRGQNQKSKFVFVRSRKSKVKTNVLTSNSEILLFRHIIRLTARQTRKG